MEKFRKHLPFYVTRNELIALVIVAAISLTGFYFWTVPANIDECKAQAKTSYDQCAGKALRAREATVDSMHFTGQGGRISDTARRGKIEECSRLREQADGVCEKTFSSKR